MANWNSDATTTSPWHLRVWRVAMQPTPQKWYVWSMIILRCFVMAVGILGLLMCISVGRSSGDDRDVAANPLLYYPAFMLHILGFVGIAALSRNRCRIDNTRLWQLVGYDVTMCALLYFVYSREYRVYQIKRQYWKQHLPSGKQWQLDDNTFVLQMRYDLTERLSVIYGFLAIHDVCGFFKRCVKREDESELPRILGVPGSDQDSKPSSGAIRIFISSH